MNELPLAQLPSPLHIHGYQLVPFPALNQAALRQVLAWRNDPAVRSHMITQAPISWEDHLRFVEALPARADRGYWQVRQAGQPVGVVSLTPFSLLPAMQGFQQGFYLAPELHGQGHGQPLLHMLQALAFQHLGLAVLYAECLPKNPRSIRLHEQVGFRCCGYAPARYQDEAGHPQPSVLFACPAPAVG